MNPLLKNLHNMNKSLYLIVLFVVSCNGSPTEIIEKKTVTSCDCKELQHHPNYNVFQLGDPLQPFTRICKEYYMGGKLKKTAQINEGKYEGKLFYYFKNGQLQSEVDYKLGLLFGHKKVYDENGNLLFHGKYKRNKLIETIYHYQEVN